MIKFREELRAALDDSVLTHTGRSIGDVASQRLADDIWPLIAAREAAWRALAEKVSEHRLSVGWGFKRTCPFCLTETEDHVADCAVIEARTLMGLE